MAVVFKVSMRINSRIYVCSGLLFPTLGKNELAILISRKAGAFHFFYHQDEINSLDLQLVQ